MVRASHSLSAAVLLAIGACGSADSGADAAGADASVADAAIEDGAAADANDSPFDAATDDGAHGDGATSGDSGSGADAGANDGGAGTPDANTSGPDANTGGADASPDAAGGIITGGPCMSGAPGATAYRIQWLDGGGTAYVDYEVNGLPDTSRDHTGAYGYSFGYTPAYVDPYLGPGGLQLNSSCFVDIELSTAGLSQIQSATLSIYGRSYSVSTSGSFSWQTFDGVGGAPTNLVSNVVPYEWYSADMTTEISPGDGGVLLRIYAGPSSNSLVVNRIELCMEAL